MKFSNKILEKLKENYRVDLGNEHEKHSSSMKVFAEQLNKELSGYERYMEDFIKQSNLGAKTIFSVASLLEHTCNLDKVL